MIQKSVEPRLPALTHLKVGAFHFNLPPTAYIFVIEALEKPQRRRNSMQIESPMTKRKRFFHYFRTHLWSLALVFLVLLGASYCDSVTPRMYRQLMKGFQEGKMDELIQPAGWLCIYTFASAALTLFGNYLTNIAGEEISAHLRMDLFSALQKMPFWFFTHSKNGHFISLFNHQLQGAHNGITRTVPRIITNIMTICMTGYQVFKSDMKVSLAFLVILPVFVLITEWLQTRLKSSHKQAHNIRAQMNDMLTANLSASAVLAQKNFGRTAQVRAGFDASSQEIRTSHENIAWFQDIYSRVIYVLFSMGTSISYVFAGLALASKDAEPGDFIQLTTSINRLQTPMMSLGTIRMEMASTIDCFEAIFEHLSNAERFTNLVNAPDRPQIKLGAWPGDIILEDVSFTYPSGDIFTTHKPESVNAEKLESDDSAEALKDGELVLKNISATIEKGSKVAMVGPNGSGKTTLAMLIAGLHVPSSGIIRAAGHHYSNLEEESFRKHVGVLDQNPWFENASIEANLKIASPSCSHEDIERVCSIANILDFINGLPKKFETVIGESAMRLSSGQRQKLALARLLLKKPSVLILDEFNSHLDTRTEAEILRVLFEQFADATVILITHRFSVLRKVDFIMHLNDGKLIEQGSHKDLIASNGAYAELYQEYRDGL